MTVAGRGWRLCKTDRRIWDEIECRWWCMYESQPALFCPELVSRRGQLAPALQRCDETLLPGGECRGGHPITKHLPRIDPNHEPQNLDCTIVVWKICSSIISVVQNHAKKASTLSRPMQDPFGTVTQGVTHTLLYL